MFNKRGQFYLFAAIIIISIILGLATISNSIRITREDSRAEELADAINIELGKFVEYQKLNPKETLSELLTEFTTNYAEQYANPSRTTYFVYIIDNDIYRYRYENIGLIKLDDNSVVNVVLSETDIAVTIKEQSESFPIDANSKKTIYIIIYETDKEGASAWAYR